MANPFDDDAAPPTVPHNDRRQHALQPAAFDMPDGRDQVFGPASRGECEAYLTADRTEHSRA
ncbi:MbtH family NRPS accessory protein [Streptomyces catenulae]|uniref:MbtH family NRPS accessory protein n=1 Tax=Streptomyces catenulae TaxID=66875 RepID=A0ABV2Z218_9ACTN|nr:MbtH family NRPS accessory protein [Streptomyces catenulae]